MMIAVGKRMVMPEVVSMREIDGELFGVYPDREQQNGIDEIGARLWTVTTTAPSIGRAYAALPVGYEVGRRIVPDDLTPIVGGPATQAFTVASAAGETG